MADGENFPIVVEIVPDVSGSATVDRALKRNEDTGQRTNKEMQKAARETARAQAQAAREAAASVRQHQRAIAAEARAASRAGQEAARNEARAFAAAKRAEVAAARAAAREEVAIAKRAAAEVRAARQADASKAANLIGLPGGSKGARGAAGGGGSALLSGALGAAAGVLGAREIAGMADTWTNAENRLRQLTKSATELAFVQDRLFQSAQSTGSAYEDVAELYGKVGKASLAMGRSHEQAINLTTMITKALKASGAEGASASAALAQLGQALDSGVLRGEEFNSMSEQAPILLDLLSKSLGVTRGELRKMAEDGKLTSQVVIEGLEKQGAAVDEAYAKRVPTITEQWTKFRNEMTKMFGELSSNAGVTQAFAAVLGTISTMLKDIVSVVGLAAGGIRELNSALGGLPAGYLEASIKYAKYANPITGLPMAGRDLYNHLSGPDQIAADTNDDLTVEARRNMARRVEKWTRAGGSTGRGNTGLDSSYVPAGTDARDFGANGVLLQADIEKRFGEIQKFFDAAEKNEKKKLSRFMGEKKAKPKDVYDWINAFEDLGNEVEGYASLITGEALGAAEKFQEQFAAEQQAEILAHKRAMEADAEQAKELQRELRDLREQAARASEEMAQVQKEIAEQMGEPMKALEEDIKQNLVGGFDEALRALFGFRDGFKEAMRDMLQEITILLAKMAALQLVQHIFGAGAGTGIGPGSTGIGGFLGGLITGNFAGGGSWVQGGTGGPDSQIAAFRTTPGETITVSKPGQSSSAGGSGVSVPLSIHLAGDPTALVMSALSSTEGERVIVDIFSKHAGKLRGALAR